MAKVCSICGKEGFAKAKCKAHYRMPSQVNPKPIKRSNAPINSFSAKKIKELAIYRKQRDKYFKQHPICEFPGCNCREITLHHMLGRIGLLLTDITHFKSLCLYHHNYVEEHPKEAFKLGLSGSRLSKSNDV